MLLIPRLSPHLQNTLRGRRSRALLALTLPLVLLASFCGPELTTPGSGDVTGTWFSAGPAVGLSNITMTLSQREAGIIKGTFTATGTPGLQTCPSPGPCALADTVRGVNTVLQVNLDLTGAGSFTGQLIAPSKLRGTMSMNLSSLIEFDRLSP